MKNLVFIMSFIGVSITTFGQVGIGTVTPNASLDISSTNQATPINTDGILIPKIDEFPVSDPGANQDGMMVFVTGNGTPARGFYYWDNGTTSWQTIEGSGAEKINELTDGRSDDDGSNNGSSIFLGVDAGINDDLTDNRNLGIGNGALNQNTTGVVNIALGYGSLRNNDVGFYNLGLGYNTLFNNTSGDNNVAVGHTALLNNLDGRYNIALGSSSLYSNDSGDFNIAIGALSLYSNTSGIYNTAIGTSALYSNTTGNYNTAVGVSTLAYNTTGINNTSLGHWSLTNNTTGYNNVGVGRHALIANTEGFNNTSIGANSMVSNIDGEFNTALGTIALTNNTGGDYNTAIGYASLGNLTTGSTNTALGAFAGLYNITGIRNVFLGYESGRDETGSQKLYIDNSPTSTPLVYGEFDINLLRVNGTLDINSAYQFPTTDGTANQVLATNGTGTIAWTDASAIDNDFIDNLTDGKSDNDGTQNGSSIFFGVNAGASDDASDNQNVGIGFESAFNNTTGSNNTAVGYQSLRANSLGNNNTAIGNLALATSFATDNNTAIGYRSLTSNTGGNNMTAVGINTLAANTTGFFNTAIGTDVLTANTTGYWNTGLGSGALTANTTGTGQLAVGFFSLQNNTVGSGNTALGPFAIQNNTNGSYNVAIGSNAGNNNITGSNNVFIGFQAGYNETGSNKLYIENSNAGPDDALVYGDFDSNSIRFNGTTFMDGRAEVFDTTDATGTANSGALEIANSLRLDANEIITNSGTTLFIQSDNNSDLEMDGGTFRLDATNNRIGVGTASPDYRFSVNGLANLNEGVSSGVALRVNGAEALWYNGTYFSWGFGGQDNFFNDPIGIGIADPVTRLQVEGGGDASLTNHGYFVMGSISGLNVVMDNNEILARDNGANSTLYIQTEGGSTSFGGDIYMNGTLLHSSDRRLKREIEPLAYGLNAITKLEPKMYYWKDKDQRYKSFGLIAQEVQDILPELVLERDMEDGYLAVNYTEIIPVLINAVKQQQQIIETLEAELKNNKQENASINNRLTRLEVLLEN